jgi:hypothetical protein
MRTRFVEVSQDATRGFNWGKFLVGVFEPEEWLRSSELERQLNRMGGSLLATRGWTPGHVLVLDLETGEGAMFAPGGSPSADLDKHRVWVCPMFEPFLGWLYGHILEWSLATKMPRDTYGWFDVLPALVELPDAEPAMQGYRRRGPEA